eukprot:TRINITY_DN7195_c0_g1_i1.p1 TRINITY_DN7195_c0_g1~~TRINITY_DN7195_c0_g1_i1.p1  ORF type:complete len:237 (+),score=54.59 TRINITY_DN7195_c0_g1_i1:77-712(+)
MAAARACFALAALPAVHSAERAGSDFGPLKQCDACLVLAAELTKLCGEDPPPGLPWSAWAIHLGERALDAAVTGWIWSHTTGDGDIAGRYKTVAELREFYSDAPPALEELDKRQRKHGKSRRAADRKRALFLEAAVGEHDDELEEWLRGECKEPTSGSRFSVAARMLCTEACPGARLNAQEYPDPERVRLMKESADREKERRDPDAWSIEL